MEKLQLYAFSSTDWDSSILTKNIIQSSLQEIIQKAHKSNVKYPRLTNHIRLDKKYELLVSGSYFKFYKDKLKVLTFGELKWDILHEAHYLGYNIYPESNKIYSNL